MTTPDPITPEPLCEGLAPFRCGNPSCPAHGVTGPTTPERVCQECGHAGPHDQQRGFCRVSGCDCDAPVYDKPCACGDSTTYSLNPAEVVVHRTDGPCYIRPTTEGANG